MSARIRMWDEHRPIRTIATGDGFITANHGDVVVVIVAASYGEAAQAIKRVLDQDREELEKLNGEE